MEDILTRERFFLFDAGKLGFNEMKTSNEESIEAKKATKTKMEISVDY